MTDMFSIGQCTVDEQATAQDQPRWTWTIGQFGADRHLYSTETEDLPKGKDKKPSLRIFANFCNLTLHTFVKPHKPTHSPSFAKECNFAWILKEYKKVLPN